MQLNGKFSQPAVVADHALDWIQARLDYFEPFQGKNKPAELRQKALVELGLLCMYLQRQSMFSHDERVQAFLQFLLQIYRFPFFYESIFRAGSPFVHQIFLTVVLHVCGFLKDDEEWQAIQKLIDHNNATFTERPPYRILELRYFLDQGKFKHSMPSYATLYRNSILTKPLNVIYAIDNEAYSITHTLFYLSDFGLRPITVLPRSRTEQTVWTVECLLGMYIHSGNWDLVGELLLSCYCLGRTTSDFYSLGWQALLDAQQSDGAVSGPYYDLEKVESLEGAHKQDYVFEQCYHTTLVAALAGALCSQG